VQPSGYVPASKIHFIQEWYALRQLWLGPAYTPLSGNIWLREEVTHKPADFKPEHACRMILVDQHNDDSTYRHMKYIHRVIKHKDTARDCFAFPAWCQRQSRSRCRAHYVWQISVLLQFTTAWRPFNVINDCYPFNDADTLMDNWYTLSCWTTHKKISH